MYESILRIPDTAIIESEEKLYKQTSFSGIYNKKDIQLEVKEEPHIPMQLLFVF